MKIFMKEGEEVIMRKHQILCFILLLVICISGCGGDKEQTVSQPILQTDTNRFIQNWSQQKNLVLSIIFRQDTLPSEPKETL